ncbi:MAG: class I SAM-dependent methyltransferase [Candidatus Thiodiazotropha lotti]|nr:class I SAM-dependent methyltransferase [Candidatus Thiodiazotropha lotti]MCG7923611.1 class I SAM-dependent methyltransferase [Candidatus Thiodiazotropha lotti]MCG7987209.1 class I SAM-dependent methyltransferase [Candidatus Thiodiazotropha lotti]MCG8005625.1 class I SAM-dependent methyltransferase [Candidatus Thiodiazotropha lotti]MCG8009993.1 class I SAM-dependent methyltransferase [Candidatus Thiodiazotropha lotti]
MAPLYDRLIGNQLFPAIVSSFEFCRRQFGLRYSLVADIGCGSGRFLKYLGRYAKPMIGIDASPEMLRICARRLRPAQVLLLRQDIRCLNLPKSADLITCNGDTLNYILSRQDLRQTLRSCQKNLNPGGYLVGDFLSGTPMPPAKNESRQLIRLPGLVSKWHWQAWPAQRMTQVNIKFQPDLSGEACRQHEIHRQRWFSEAEFKHDLNAAGLHVCRIWPLLAQEGMGPKGRWLKFVARRNKGFV